MSHGDLMRRRQLIGWEDFDSEHWHSGVHSYPTVHMDGFKMNCQLGDGLHPAYNREYSGCSDSRYQRSWHVTYARTF